MSSGGCEYIHEAYISNVDTGTGVVTLNLKSSDELYNKTLKSIMGDVDLSKAGLLKIRVYRPFRSEEVAKALSHLKAVAVLDKSDSLNGIGGALFEDVTTSMFVNQVSVPTVNYVYGIGGRDTKADDIEKVYEDLLEISKTGSADNPYRYFGVRKEAE